MKIQVGVVIQDKNIDKNTEHDFLATYKGKQIEITTNHAHGEAKYKHLMRYDISVVDVKSGMIDVYTYQDFHNMKDAIRYALKGCCLIKSIY